MCEHGKVDYKTLVKLNKRHYQMNWRLIDIIERLERTNTILTDANKEFSEAFVEMEKKFSLMGFGLALSQIQRQKESLI